MPDHNSDSSDNSDNSDNRLKNPFLDSATGMGQSVAPVQSSCRSRVGDPLQGPAQGQLGLIRRLAVSS